YWDIIWNYPRCAGGAIWDWMSPGIREKVRLIEDGSPNKIQCAIKGRAQLVPGISGQAVRLNGHDQWVDVYRHQALDLEGNQLTLAFWVKPGKWNGDGHFLTKGSWQYGIVQSEPDSLVFYLTTNAKNVLKVPIPQPWEEKWHQIAGVYTGSEMLLYVDGVLAGRKTCSGSIANKPFPVNLGRDAEIDGQEYPGPTNNATLDEVGIFCQALKEE
ncbi:MAG: LamG domain-containing protein, partial [Bacteroidales bacterium]|nr:LamG domain-containing protein [Bacteroidales bacterium]